MAVRLSFPVLTPAQERALAGARRYNVVAGGRDSGLTTLAHDVLLAGPLGAVHGRAVGLFLPDPEALLEAKREVLGRVARLVRGRMDRERVELVTGGSILFRSLDAESLEIWGQLSLVVVDQAGLVPRLGDLWDKDLARLVAPDGQAWIVGRPAGLLSGFHRLWEIDSPEWSRQSMASWENPHADQGAVEAARAAGPELVFRQEYGGEFVAGVELAAAQMIIGADETFVQWCERLAASGLRVDEKPFRLDDRPAMRWVYEQIPSTLEEARGLRLYLMKCAQVGFTVMEMLAQIYLGLKFAPLFVGMYLPDMALARIKSSERFLPIVRTVPDAYRLMVGADDGTGRGGGEGNVMVRHLGASKYYFLWTSGKGATESVPLDVLSLDEVQEMRIADMEKVRERLSASPMRFVLAGSTANWPDQDIHWLYKQGSRHRFHTRCPSCGESSVLDDHFPDCIRFDAVRGDYAYCCPHCSGWIEDTQAGAWVPEDPAAIERKVISVHFPQILSPTISAREMIEAYYNAEDLKNYYNRKLGKPFLDPTTVPVNMEMLNDCARLGVAAGVVWRGSAAGGTFMGIDQMGQFNVVLIAERLATGHLAIIHAQMIFDEDPFAVCSELIGRYGVQVCVVETLPNYNDAKRFANRHKGVVFLASYGDLKDDMLRWGDAVPSRQDRKTEEEERDRYTVSLDQYKVMQVAMNRIQKRQVLFPDPGGLVQEIAEKGISRPVALLREVVFLHFTRTALIAEKDDEERKFRRRVVKVGIDPHFSYAYMLLSVAWTRAYGTATFLFPDAPGLKTEAAQVVREAMPGLPSGVVDMIESAVRPDTCGACANFQGGQCVERGFAVGSGDPSCPIFVLRVSS